MIQNERASRHEHVLDVARQMMTAARTAPKGKGVDIIEIAMVTGDDLKVLSDKMVAMVEEHGMKDTNPIRSSICKAAKNIAQAVGAKAIIVESATGRVARAMVHYRPDCPVIAVATSQLVCRKLCLNWGVMAVMGEEKRTSDSITKQAMEKALSTGVVKKGDTVVVLSSNKTCPTSSTDSLNVRIL